MIVQNINAFLVSERSNRSMRFRNGIRFVPATIIPLSRNLKSPAKYRNAFTGEVIEVQDAGIPVSYSEDGKLVGSILHEVSATLITDVGSVPEQTVFIESFEVLEAIKCSSRLYNVWSADLRSIWIPVFMIFEMIVRRGWMKVSSDGINADLIFIGLQKDATENIKIELMHDSLIKIEARVDLRQASI